MVLCGSVMAKAAFPMRNLYGVSSSVPPYLGFNLSKGKYTLLVMPNGMDDSSVANNASGMVSMMSFLLWNVVLDSWRSCSPLKRLVTNV